MLFRSMISTNGELISTEHGPRGGDELNIIKSGRNYGWPEVTLGTQYLSYSWPYNKKQGRHEGFESPIFSWSPSIAVSNLIEVRDFDDRFTAPVNGFAGASDYYQQSSSKDQLGQITTPTTILIAEDDPVVPVHIFADVKLSATTTLLRTRHGGHLGYLSARLAQGDHRWMDWKVIELLLEN